MNEPTIADALALSKHFPVYPLARHSVIPPKATNGHLGATQDEDELFHMFTEIAPEGNIGASLVDTDIIVIDVDVKNDKNGMNSLGKIMAVGESLGDPVVVDTKNGGKHFYYKTNADIEHKIDWLEGVDVLRNNVILPPSIADDVNGQLGSYELVKGSFDDIKALPKWIERAILNSQKEKDSFITVSYQPRKKKYTASLIEEWADGIAEGGRNEWLTSQIGKMLSLGTSADATYQMACVLNQSFISPPLKDNEVNKIFGSILKRESRKQVQV